MHPGHSVHFEHSVEGDSEYSDFAENMAQPPPRERTLREMAAPDFTYKSLCIQYPDEGVPYVLKTRLILLLLKFIVLQVKILISILRSSILFVRP